MTDNRLCTPVRLPYIRVEKKKEEEKDTEEKETDQE